MAESKSRAYSSEAWHRLVRKMLKASVAVCGGVCPSECHRLGGLGDRNGLSHSSGGYTSKIKVSAGDAPLWAEGESVPDLSPSFWWPRVFPALALCLHVVFSLWVSVSVSKFLLFYKDTSHTGLGPPLVTSKLDTSRETLSPTKVTF